MRKYLLHVLIISFVFFLTPTIQAAVALGETIEARKQAVKKKSDDAKTHFDLGVAYLKSGMYKESIEALKQATRVDPDYAKAHKTLGYVYLNLYMNKDAIESLKQVVRINPDATAHYNLGFVYGRSGMYKEAIEVYKRAIFINTGYIDAYNNLGNACGKLVCTKRRLEQYEILKDLDYDLSDKLFRSIKK
jgi:tetratricopeptide (TPR) repeat protein